MAMLSLLPLPITVLKIRVAPVAAAGVTDHLGLWWELLLPATAKAHPSPARSCSCFSPALFLSFPQLQQLFKSTFSAKKLDLMFAIKKFKYKSERHLLQHSPKWRS